MQRLLGLHVRLWNKNVRNYISLEMLTAEAASQNQSSSRTVKMPEDSKKTAEQYVQHSEIHLNEMRLRASESDLASVAKIYFMQTIKLNQAEKDTFKYIAPLRTQYFLVMVQILIKTKNHHKVAPLYDNFRPFLCRLGKDEEQLFDILLSLAASNNDMPFLSKIWTDMEKIHIASSVIEKSILKFHQNLPQQLVHKCYEPTMNINLSPNSKAKIFLNFVSLLEKFKQYDEIENLFSKFTNSINLYSDSCKDTDHVSESLTLRLYLNVLNMSLISSNAKYSIELWDSIIALKYIPAFDLFKNILSLIATNMDCKDVTNFYESSFKLFDGFQLKPIYLYDKSEYSNKIPSFQQFFEAYIFVLINNGNIDEASLAHQKYQVKFGNENI
jgi:hypothetical protein